jgi:hypothetical protein
VGISAVILEMNIEQRVNEGENMEEILDLKNDHAGFIRLTSKDQIAIMKAKGKKIYIEYGPKDSQKITEPIESFAKNMLDPEIAHENGLFDEAWMFRMIAMTDQEYKNLPEWSGF